MAWHEKKMYIKNMAHAGHCTSLYILNVLICQQAYLIGSLTYINMLHGQSVSAVP